MKNEVQKKQELKVFRLPGTFEELKDKLLEANHLVDMPPSGIQPHADPKGPPLYFFEMSNFG